MTRFLEQNGYDVSYISGVDTARFASARCWSTRSSFRSATTNIGLAEQGDNVEAARDAGVNLAFLQRERSLLENSLECRRRRQSLRHDGLLQGDARKREDRPAARRLDRNAGAIRVSVATDGGRPENALTGTIFTVNAVESAIFGNEHRRLDVGIRRDCGSGETPRSPT